MKLDAEFGSSQAELKANFKKLAKICHPDVCTDKIWATREFRELVADLKFRINRKEVKPPPPKPQPRIQRATASMGYSAYMKSGITVIECDVFEGYTDLQIKLHGKPLKEYGLQTHSDFFHFSIPLPSTFEEGHIVTIQNLPFACQVKLFHKKRR
jgi:hypothetical protein